MVIKIIIIYILGVIYTRWMNKFLYENTDSMPIILIAWFIPIIGPLGMTVAFFGEYGETLWKKMTIKFKFLNGFSGENWKQNSKK